MNKRHIRYFTGSPSNRIYAIQPWAYRWPAVKPLQYPLLLQALALQSPKGDAPLQRTERNKNCLVGPQTTTEETTVYNAQLTQPSLSLRIQVLLAKTAHCFPWATPERALEWQNLVWETNTYSQVGLQQTNAVHYPAFHGYISTTILKYEIFQTISKRSRECWFLIGHKNCFVLLCPIGEQHLLGSFREFVYDGYWLDHDLSGSCTKEMHAVRNLSVWYKRYISKYW